MCSSRAQLALAAASRIAWWSVGDKLRESAVGVAFSWRQAPTRKPPSSCRRLAQALLCSFVADGPGRCGTAFGTETDCRTSNRMARSHWLIYMGCFHWSTFHNLPTSIASSAQVPCADAAVRPSTRHANELQFRTGSIQYGTAQLSWSLLLSWPHSGRCSSLECASR